MISRDLLYPARRIMMRYCLAMFSVFICCLAIAQNPKPPLVNLSGDLVSNNASVSMTAFAINGTFALTQTVPGGIMEERETTVYFDSLVESRLHSIAPGQSRGIAIVKDPPSRMVFLAAVFEDGSTYGDPDGVRGILDRRKEALAAYQDSIAMLEADLKGGKSNQQIQVEFKTAQTEARARFRDSGYLVDIYNLVINSMSLDVLQG